LSPAFLPSDAAAPATDVAVNETALSVPEVALRTFAPVVGPSVHEPTVAMPLAFVVAVGPETDPPPLTTVNVTSSPATGEPFWSVTTTDGDGETGAPAVPVIDVEELAASDVATSGTAGVLSPLHPTSASRATEETSRALRKENFIT
jgi:hypothetical protein